ncbi:hypothetical protein, partial [Corynebacterium belfantii]|uniref:hypothetical protein n=1 Tax=Corynebacterium belfantii TaxID=2014537 RepID=UPI001A7E26F5
DQTLHKKSVKRPTLLSWNESNQLAKNHHKQHNIACDWQKNKKIMICSIKNVAIIPLTRKNNHDHQHNNSQ